MVILDSEKNVQSSNFIVALLFPALNMNGKEIGNKLHMMVYGHMSCYMSYVIGKLITNAR